MSAIKFLLVRLATYIVILFAFSLLLFSLYRPDMEHTFPQEDPPLGSFLIHADSYQDLVDGSHVIALGRFSTLTNTETQSNLDASDKYLAPALRGLIWEVHEYKFDTLKVLKGEPISHAVIRYPYRNDEESQYIQPKSHDKVVIFLLSTESNEIAHRFRFRDGKLFIVSEYQEVRQAFPPISMDELQGLID